MGHILPDGTHIWSKKIYTFTSPPFPGQESLQRVIIFGDMGKVVKLKLQKLRFYIIKSFELNHGF